MNPNQERFPRQQDCDPENPEEHFLWALTQIPYNDRVTQPIQQKIARVMSKHLTNCGFVHADYLRSKADENGYIHVSQLPEQQVKLQMPHRGQQHYMNGMAVWVPMDAEDPDPVELPNVRKLTRQEQEFIKQELEDVGVIQPPERDLGLTARTTSWKTLKAAGIKSARELLKPEATE